MSAPAAESMSPTPSDEAPSPDQCRFVAAVRERSWEWLLTLCRRFNVSVDLQIVDSGNTLLLEQRAGGNLATDVWAILAAGDFGLQRALSTARRTKTPQYHQVEGVQVACFPLTLHRAVSGALVLALHESAAEQHGDQTRNDLELVGSWLSAAVESHLTSSPGLQEALGRVSSFRRMLSNAASEGSDRRIVTVFAETMAVWHDLEVCGYVETPNGTCAREVTLAGADPSKSPAVIEQEALPVGMELVQPSAIEVERLGFPEEQNLAVRRLGEGLGSWLITVSGALASHEVTVLTLYLALLDDAIEGAANVRAASAVKWMAKLLFEDAAELAEQASRAAAVLRETTGATTVALAATTANGTPVVRVVSPTVTIGTGGPASVEPASPLVIVRHAPQQYSMKIGLERADGRHVTRLEHQVANASADVIESWVRWVLGHGVGGERRGSTRGFTELLESSAQHALEHGDSVLLLVLSYADTLFRPDVTQSRIALIRTQIRAGDLVGMLSEDDVGILLRTQGDEQASTVVDRLRQLIEASETAPSSAMRVGTASRTPALPAVESLVQDARNARG